MTIEESQMKQGKNMADGDSGSDLLSLRKAKFAEIKAAAQYGTNPFNIEMKFIITTIIDKGTNEKKSVLRFGDSGFHMEIAQQLCVELMNSVLGANDITMKAPYVYVSKDGTMVPLGTIINTVDKEFTIEIKGGGMLYKNDSKKQIYVWGRSTNYGAPDFAEVVKLLESAYTNYSTFNKNPTDDKH